MQRTASLQKRYSYFDLEKRGRYHSSYGYRVDQNKKQNYVVNDLVNVEIFCICREGYICYSHEKINNYDKSSLAFLIPFICYCYVLLQKVKAVSKQRHCPMQGGEPQQYSIEMPVRIPQSSLQ